MKAILRMGIALAGLAAMPVLSQVQLFEQDLSGLVPYVGLKANAAITEGMLGFEYNIEGRSTLGISVSKPTSDTVHFDRNHEGVAVSDAYGTKTQALIYNPYAIFEFIEPGNLSTFSFAVRGDLIWETLLKPTENLNDFRRVSIGGGPIFAFRMWNSDRFAMIPSVAYELYYVNWKKDLIQDKNTPGDKLGGEFTDGVGVAHELTAGYAFYYKFSEFHGITCEPKLSVKFGNGETGITSKDLVNGQLTIGYVWTM